jgi:uncharacterized protein YdiU (UPF0061 family)
MNGSDNMSIIGDTIDYGPFGFLDAFNPNFTANGSGKIIHFGVRNSIFILFVPV